MAGRLSRTVSCRLPSSRMCRYSDESSRSHTDRLDRSQTTRELNCSTVVFTFQALHHGGIPDPPPGASTASGCRQLHWPRRPSRLPPSRVPREFHWDGAILLSEVSPSGGWLDCSFLHSDDTARTLILSRLFLSVSDDTNVESCHASSGNTGARPVLWLDVLFIRFVHSDGTV
jgi:hypothetical protein